MSATFRKLSVAVAFTALTVVGLPTFTTAQEDVFRTAGEKVTGQAYWPARATTRYLQSAQNYAQDIQAHVAKAGRPEPAVVAEAHKTLTGYLEESSKHLASMKKDFAGDKETVAAIEKMEKGLATAVSHNKALIESLKNEEFNKVMALTSSADLSKELGKVHAEHVALMKKLSEKHSTPPAKK